MVLREKKDPKLKTLKHAIYAVSAYPKKQFFAKGV